MLRFRSDETERISDLVGGGMPPALHVVQLIIVITDNYNGEEKEETVAESLIPAKYNNAETSGLTATVAPGDNTINFDLSDE